jgi:hypothetical protein
VERNVQFVMACQSIAVLWYAQPGRAATDLTVRRARTPWYRHMTHISMTDILAAFHRVRIDEVIAAQARDRVIVIAAVNREATAAQQRDSSAARRRRAGRRHRDTVRHAESDVDVDLRAGHGRGPRGPSKPVRRRNSRLRQPS